MTRTRRTVGLITMQVDADKQGCGRLLGLLFRRCFGRSEMRQAAHHITLFEPHEDSFEGNIDLAESLDGKTNIASDPRFDTGIEIDRVQGRRVTVASKDLSGDIADAMNVTFGDSSCMFVTAEARETRETESEGK